MEVQNGEKVEEISLSRNAPLLFQRVHTLCLRYSVNVSIHE